MTELKVGNRFKLFRKTVDRRQSELAEDCNINRSTISLIENNVIKPNAKTVTILAKEYKLNIHWLYTGEGNMFTDVAIEEQFKRTNAEIETKNIELVREIQDLKDKLYSKIEKIERLQDELLQETKNKYGNHSKINKF